jgi:hypothetical protein
LHELPRQKENSGQYLGFFENVPGLRRERLPVKRISISGASECGKTTLAIHLSRAYWSVHKMRTLALDIWKEENSWGPQAWVTKSEKIFFGTYNEEKKDFDGGAIWQTRGDLVVVDEASSTIKRDRDLVPLFVKIRHCKHTLLVICHDATDLLPTMRRNLNEVFLFAQAEDALKLWQKDLPLMRGMSLAAVTQDGQCKLQPYEFVHCENYKDGQIKKLSL